MNPPKRQSILGGVEGDEWTVVSKDDGMDEDCDFEMMNDSEARCWCGGMDSELCRFKGHTFPIRKVDGSESSQRFTPAYVRSSHHEGIWVISGPVSGDAQESARFEDDASGENGSGRQSTLQKPFSDGIDPISKVIILSNLLKVTGRKSNAEGL